MKERRGRSRRRDVGTRVCDARASWGGEARRLLSRESGRCEAAGVVGEGNVIRSQAS